MSAPCIYCFVTTNIERTHPFIQLHLTFLTGALIRSITSRSRQNIVESYIIPNDKTGAWRKILDEAEVAFRKHQAKKLIF